MPVSSITQYSSDPAVYVKNVQITNNVPTVTGGTADKGFSVQPSLPDGLVLDEDTGVISGTPVVKSGAQEYSIQVYGDDWNQLGEDIDGETAGDWSGFSVSLSSDGRIVAIGAHMNDGNGERSGHVRIYEYSGSTWTQLGQDIDGEAAYNSSGISVSLSSDGKIVAIGATGNHGNGIQSGHVRIYRYIGFNLGLN